MPAEEDPLLAPNQPVPPAHPIIVYDSQLSHPEYTTNAPINFRSSPFIILRHDLGVVLKHAKEIPNIFLPLPGRGSKQKDVKIIGVIAQIVFVAVSLVLTVAVVASFATGFPPPWVAAVAVTLAVLAMSASQGDVKCEHQKGTGKDKDEYEDEVWIFVNGIATSYSGLQLIIDHLHILFKRRVIGIHNKTFGFWWDLVECMISRDFMWPTEDVRVGYAHIADPKKTKVVLMAHSQGGIIMSAWVDQLLSDFSAEELSKVEIYTFAAAANHFSVPATRVYPGSNIEPRATTEEFENGVAENEEGQEHGSLGTFRQVFAIVEHFVNTRDYVSLIGLIEFAPKAPDGTEAGVLPYVAAEGRFAGRIFKRIGHTGHLLLTHYLKIDDSILDHPTVRQYSQLVKYLGGQKATVQQRVWKRTVGTGA